MFFDDTESDLAAVGISDVAPELFSCAVENRDSIAAPQPQHIQSVVRFAAGQDESVSSAPVGWQVEAVGHLRRVEG